MTLTLYLLFMKCLQSSEVFIFWPSWEKCLFKWCLLRLILGVGLDLLLAFYLKVVSSSNIFIISVLLSHFGFMNKAHALWFRTCLNLSVPALQFAAAHLGYLRLCLEMSYHPGLTASGTDKTLTCVSGQTILRPAQSPVKGAIYLRLQPPNAKIRTTKFLKCTWILGDCLFFSFYFIKCHER